MGGEKVELNGPFAGVKGWISPVEAEISPLQLKLNI
jgi:hypothetical protein